MNSSSVSLTKPKEYDSTVDADGQSQEQVSGSQSTMIDERIIIPLDNVAYAPYPSINEPHDSNSGSSQILDVVALSRSPEIICPDQNIPGPDDLCLTPYLTSSPQLDRGYFPLADAHRRSNLHRHKRSPHSSRSDARGSIEQLGSGEMSSSRDFTLVDGSSYLSIIPPANLCPQETLVSSPTCEQDLKDAGKRLKNIFPVAPEMFKRHEKRRKIPRVATRVTMSPLLRDFSDYDEIPGWTTCVHPEGGRYFHHAKKRIFTDTDLHDSAYLNRITRVITKIDGVIDDFHVQISEKTDLVLDVNEVKGKWVTDYYFADHERRIVFFLDEFSSDNLPHWPEIKGVSSGPHLRQALETQYWWHCHTYPNCIELSDGLICEMRDSLMYFISDCTTSPYANSPYTLENLEKLLGYTNSLKDNIGPGKANTGCICFLGRLMHSISDMRFLNFHGQPEARLNRDQSVYGDRTNRRTWFIKTISLLLFSAPDVQLKTLQKMWVDGILHKAVWEQSLKKVTDEWREFTLYATVLLNANVAFLAIQSVDSTHNPYRSPAQISSYCSISCSVGSIILGLLLVRQNQTKHRETVRDVQKFLMNRAHPWLGLETLAIMFSLPYALLMWGMVSFLMAFWFMCLVGSGVATRSVVGTVWIMLLGLITWCIWTAWEKKLPSDADTPDENLSFEEDPDRQKGKRFTFERATIATPDSTDDPSWFTKLSLPTTNRKIRSDSVNTMVPEQSPVDEKGKSCVDEKGQSSVDDTGKSYSGS
ncbi:hypothetical protein BYT27DRAFT_7201001 [Phlegmacium glaucopus]|nr:hypothetical protein BYT27DRAFT_7201001 [Phlegmacium glaucopus]